MLVGMEYGERKKEEQMLKVWIHKKWVCALGGFLDAHWLMGWIGGEQARIGHNSFTIT